MNVVEEISAILEPKGLKAFKVPKKNISNACSIERISLDSSEYRESMFSKIKSTFKVPSSINHFKISKAYLINTPENEKNFNKRKQVFRKEYSPHAASELYGFLYFSNFKALEKVVKAGKLKIGNLKESYIGKPEMGLSLCQCADVYQFSENKSFAKSGFLLIVKYLRGRVCYVIEDLNPLDAQPNFDCHISRAFSHDSYPSLTRAFHSTQIYLYEYSEDYDIIDLPSHILLWGAVEFQWTGSPVYKLINSPLTAQRSQKDSNQKNVEKRNKLSNRITGSVGTRIKQTFTDCVPLFCTNLQILSASNNCNSAHPELGLDVPVTLVSYNPSWNLYGSMVTPTWRMCDLIEWSSFEHFLLNYHWKVNNTKSSSNPTTMDASNLLLTDVLSKRITLSRNTENKLKASEATSLSISNRWQPKDQYYINYFRMVVSDPSKDRAKIARLIEYFLETKTVGRIKLEEKPDTLLYVFPDCNLSQNFGIPSVRTLDVNYLHVLLLKTRPLEFEMEKFNEAIETNIVTYLRQLSVNQEAGQDEPIVKKFVLQQTIRNQNAVQKHKLRQMCGIQLDSRLSMPRISFEVPVPCAPPPKPTDAHSSGATLSSKGSGKSRKSTSKKSVSPDYQDRPYDPIENPLGLSEDAKQKFLQSTSKRSHSDAGLKKCLKTSTNSESLSFANRKKCKKEEKDKLNTKLLEIFAKIENSSLLNTTITTKNDTPKDVPHENSTKIREPSPTPAPVTSKNNSTTSEPKSLLGNYYNTTLDSSKFQKTSYRHGISVYNPDTSTLTTSTNSYYKGPHSNSNGYYDSRPHPPISTGDKDLRFQDTSLITKEIERYSYPSPSYQQSHNSSYINNNMNHHRPPPTYSQKYIPLKDLRNSRSMSLHNGRGIPMDDGHNSRGIPMDDVHNNRGMPLNDVHNSRGMTLNEFHNSRGIPMDDVHNSRCLLDDVHNSRNMPLNDVHNSRSMTLNEFHNSRGIPMDDVHNSRSMTLNDFHNSRAIPMDDVHNSRAMPLNDVYNSRSMPLNDIYNSRAMPLNDVHNSRGIPMDDVHNSRGMPMDDVHNNRGMPMDDTHNSRAMSFNDFQNSRSMPLNEIHNSRGIPMDDIHNSRGMHLDDVRNNRGMHLDDVRNNRGMHLDDVRNNRGMHLDDVRNNRGMHLDDVRNNRGMHLDDVRNSRGMSLNDIHSGRGIPLDDLHNSRCLLDDIPISRGMPLNDYHNGRTMSGYQKLPGNNTNHSYYPGDSMHYGGSYSGPPNHNNGAMTLKPQHRTSVNNGNSSRFSNAPPFYR